MNIKDIVNETIEKYGTNNPFELCDLLKIKIAYSKLGNINGYFIKVPKNKFIVLNEDLNCVKQKFVCAHELGHALLHSELNTLFLQRNTLNIKGKYENQANEFAAELLIDDDLLRYFEGYSIDTISNSTGIDSKYLELKIKNN